MHRFKSDRPDVLGGVVDSDGVLPLSHLLTPKTEPLAMAMVAAIKEEPSEQTAGQGSHPRQYRQEQYEGRPNIFQSLVHKSLTSSEDLQTLNLFSVPDRAPYDSESDLSDFVLYSEGEEEERAQREEEELKLWESQEEERRRQEAIEAAESYPEPAPDPFDDYGNLLPEVKPVKPKFIPAQRKDYFSAYNTFLEWAKIDQESAVHKVTEKILIKYFNWLRNERHQQAVTLISKYSRIKLAHQIRTDVDIGEWRSISKLVRSFDRNYEGPEGVTFDLEQIHAFLARKDLRNLNWFQKKAVAIVCTYGGLKPEDARWINSEHLSMQADGYYVTCVYTEPGKRREKSINFMIPFYREESSTLACPASLLQKYLEKLSKFSEGGIFGPLFRTIVRNDNKFGRLQLGRNALNLIGQEIAEEMEWEQPEKYAGSCFRRSAAARQSEEACLDEEREAFMRNFPDAAGEDEKKGVIKPPKGTRVPEAYRSQYHLAYSEMLNWAHIMEGEEKERVTEELMMHYCNYLRNSKSRQPRTVKSKHNMIRTCHIEKTGVDIYEWLSLQRLIRSYTPFFAPLEAGIFSMDQLHTFLAMEHLNDTYWLLRKAVAAICVFGRIIPEDLRQITTQNVRLERDGYLIEFIQKGPTDKTMEDVTSFTVPLLTENEAACPARALQRHLHQISLIREDPHLVPLSCIVKQMDGDYHKVWIGKLELNLIGRQVADEMGFPYPERYKGSCWKRCAADRLSEDGCYPEEEEAFRKNFPEDKANERKKPNRKVIPVRDPNKPKRKIQRGPIFTCDWCEAKIDGRREYKKHRRKKQCYRNIDGKMVIWQESKGPPDICPICAKEYKPGNKKHFEHHIASHGPKVHQCPDCGKMYSTPFLLKRHRADHTKPCKCEKCPQAFNNTLNLKQHMLKAHTPPEEWPFKCKHCPKTFTVSTHMRNHENTHMNIRPHKCRFCERGFNAQSNMLAHERQCDRRIQQQQNA